MEIAEFTGGVRSRNLRQAPGRIMVLAGMWTDSTCVNMQRDMTSPIGKARHGKR